MNMASASTHADPYYEEYLAMDPHGLDTSQLCYELSLRHMPVNGSARYQAIVVADQLRLERSGQIPRNHLQNSPYTVRHDLQECENLCRFLEGAAENRRIDSMALRTYLSKAIHLVMRVKRIRTATQEQRALQRDMIRRMTMVRYEFKRQQNPDDVSLLLEGLTFNTSLPDYDDEMQPQRSNQIPTVDQARSSEAAAMSSIVSTPRFGLTTNNQRPARRHRRRRRRSHSGRRSSNPRVVPVNHWRISFSGEANSSNKFDLNIHKFLQQVKLFRRASNISRRNLLRQIIHLLNGSARDWYQNASRNIHTWEQFVTALKAKFLPTDYNFQLMAQAQRRQQDKNESVAQYINAMEMIFSSMSRHADPEWQLTVVCANLLPQYSDLVVAQAPQSIAEIEKICKRRESAMEHKKYFAPPTQTSRQYTQRPKVFAAEEESIVSASENDGEETEANVCAVMRRSNDNKKKLQHKKTAPKEGEKSNNNARVDASAEAGRVIVCFNCDGNGHMHRDCPTEKRVFCYNCGAKGVTSKDCPKCSTRASKNGQANLIDLEQLDSSPNRAANLLIATIQLLSRMK